MKERLMILGMGSICGFAEPLQTPQELYVAKREYVESWIQHVGHAPLITDITFRSSADFVIDQLSVFFDPASVKAGDTIYVNACYLAWFEQVVHPQIQQPYILLTCDYGGSFPDPETIYKLLFDPKLSAWFCKNMVFSHHPKLFQLPMGHHIVWWGNVDLTPLWTKHLQRPFWKKRWLYMNHYPRQIGDRDKIVKQFENESYCFSRNSSKVFYLPVDRDVYYDDLASSCFVISPLGLESDCVRNWEAFLFDCIPILEHSFFDSIFEGLPVVLIHDWEEVNEGFLQQQYEKIAKQPLQNEKMYFDYWHQKIKDKQAEIRRGDFSCSRLEATQFQEQDLENLCAILQRERKTGLVYRSLLTPLHAIQVAKALPWILKIYLYDPWLSKAKFLNLSSFLKEGLQDFLEQESKIEVPFDLDSNYTHLWSLHGTSPIFLDLTYYAASLFRDDKRALHDMRYLRHRLLIELEELYRDLLPGVLVCGNRAKDEYVQGVLERFTKRYGEVIETEGNFWFFRKSAQILRQNTITGEMEVLGKSSLP